ncbi:MAG: diguanylate cyclase [Gammaproteobacteria bacterium]|nr:diguanylate cyclase [Gammaproteobacteria bacterium]
MKVLIVERSRLQQTALSRIFSAENVIVSIAHNYTSAMERLSEEEFDIVCTSYNIDEQRSGIDLAKEVRLINKYHDIPVLLMASFDNELSKHQAYNAGITEVFGRNNFKELEENIKSLLRRRICTINAHILYVEDSKTAAKLMMKTLRDTNVSFDHFFSADKAIIAYREHQPKYDMVITDVVLEGKLDGLGFVRALREVTPDNYKMPVLAVSGLDDTSRRVELLRSGANDYIVKPYVKEELLVRVKNLITTKHLFDQVETQQNLLYKQVMQDYLTGLHNRYAMDTLLPKYCSAAIRHKKPIGILFFDIDRFKQVNDIHGHAAGDDVLTKIGNLVLTSFRSEDFSARFGGEEFIVILYNITHKQMLTIAEKFRHKIEQTDFSGLNVTISIGAINTYINTSSAVHKLLGQTDKLLYKAKKSGRNKVCALDLTAIKGG